jgi:hypothetical protein
LQHPRQRKNRRDVEVFFNLRGRPWTDRNGKKSYFNTLALWKINILSGATPAQQASAPQYAPPADINATSEDDDLPF